jgi:hypothetical protein
MRLQRLVAGPPPPLLNVLAVLAPLGLCTPLAIASESDAQRIPNYAFATQLGSGIYEVNDRTVQIYRFAPAFSLLSLEERKWGTRLRFPVTLGFYDFAVTDVVSSGLPNHLTTVALVPTVDILLVPTRNWYLTPFGGIGVGKDLWVGSTSFIHAAGLKSLTLFPMRSIDTRLGVRFVYTGYSTKHYGFRDDYSLLETGLDVRRSLGIRLFGHELAASLFGMNYLYVISPQLWERRSRGGSWGSACPVSA